MQAVPAFHNGFLTGYTPAPTNYRPIVTNLVRMAACLLLLASVSMQSYAPPAPAIDYTFSQHQKPRSTAGLTLGDLTMEELEDERMAMYDAQNRIREKVEAELNESNENALHIDDLNLVIEGRAAETRQKR